LDVYDRLTELLAQAQDQGADQIAEVVTAHRAYLRTVLGERPTASSTSAKRRVAQPPDGHPTT
jgi:hypothetical protein